MCYAFVDIRYALAIEALLYGLILVESVAMSQALKLQFFESLLDLAEGQFNRVIFRRVGDIVDVFNFKPIEQNFDIR